jgi:hypothetical protein
MDVGALYIQVLDAGALYIQVWVTLCNPNIKYSLSHVYDAGTQATFGCNASNVFFKAVSFPRLEKTIFVVLLIPVQSRIGTCVGLACTVGVPAPGIDVALELPLFVDVH